MTVVGDHEAGRSRHRRGDTATVMVGTGADPDVRTGGGTGAPVPGPGGFPYVSFPEMYGEGDAETLELPVVRQPVPQSQPAGALVPRLSAGLRLHGEYQGSGFTEPKYIARRGDGQVVQLSRLLHLTASAIDGVRDMAAVAREVSAGFGREVSAENVAYLVEHKLDPLGVTVPDGQEDDEVDGPRSDLLLSLKGHRVVFNERKVAVIARSLAWLHRPTVVVLVLLLAVAMDTWLFGFYGAMTPVLHVLDQPLLLLAVFALTVASLVFHEFGHASACRYGGAHPGCIGCGLFLIWPSMYTDVTDVYRIGRADRIRTDLGGVYFNVVFMLLLTGAYFATGQPFLLSAVYLGHFEVLEQLMPAVRLDGYFILGDLAGVPDLYGKIKPILLSMLPWRPTDPAVADLKRSTRVIVTTWVLTMVPLLVGDLCYALWNLPRLVATGIRSLTGQLARHLRGVRRRSGGQRARRCARQHDADLPAGGHDVPVDPAHRSARAQRPAGHGRAAAAADRARPGRDRRGDDPCARLDQRRHAQAAAARAADRPDPAAQRGPGAPGAGPRRAARPRPGPRTQAGLPGPRRRPPGRDAAAVAHPARPARPALPAALRRTHRGAHGARRRAHGGPPSPPPRCPRPWPYRPPCPPSRRPRPPRPRRPPRRPPRPRPPRPPPTATAPGPPPSPAPTLPLGQTDTVITSLSV
ncbi:hypothetical protein GCM10020000_41790 [Streptomyces olivoverticillatus]